MTGNRKWNLSDKGIFALNRAINQTCHSFKFYLIHADFSLKFSEIQIT